MNSIIKYFIQGGNIMDQFDCFEDVLEDIDDIEELEGLEAIDVFDEIDDIDEFDTDFDEYNYEHSSEEACLYYE